MPPASAMLPTRAVVKSILSEDMNPRQRMLALWHWDQKEHQGGILLSYEKDNKYASCPGGPSFYPIVMEDIEVVIERRSRRSSMRTVN